MSSISNPTPTPEPDRPRPWPVVTRLLFAAVALPVMGVFIAVGVSNPSGGGVLVGAILAPFMIILSFFEGVFGGIGVGWSAFSGALDALTSLPLGNALVFGILGGLAIALVQRLTWLPTPAPVKKSVASTLASNEFWIGTVVDSARLVAINLAVAYGVVALMSAVGVFAAPDGFAAGLHHITAAGGTGLGGDGTFADLLFALVFSLGLFIALGLLSGVSFGAAVGAIFGAVGWTGLAVPTLKGAAKGATIAIFEHEQESLIQRAATGAMYGALNGALGGMIIAVALGVLQVCGVSL